MQENFFIMLEKIARQKRSREGKSLKVNCNTTDFEDDHSAETLDK